MDAEDKTPTVSQDTTLSGVDIKVEESTEKNDGKANRTKMDKPGKKKKESTSSTDGSDPPVVRYCKVCGSPSAAGHYFGVLSCIPCKAFFIRCLSELENGIPMQCVSQDNPDKCEITVETRTVCKSCRYQKCINEGMARKERPACVSNQEGRQLCAVCADIANGVHFGAVTCEGCKKFFRRGLNEASNYTCRFEKSCVLNPRTRNSCRYCRWQKCLQVGMSRNAIRMGRPSKFGSLAANKKKKTDHQLLDGVNAEEKEDNTTSQQKQTVTSVSQDQDDVKVIEGDKAGTSQGTAICVDEEGERTETINKQIEKDIDATKPEEMKIVSDQKSHPDNKIKINIIPLKPKKFFNMRHHIDLHEQQNSSPDSVLQCGSHYSSDDSRPSSCKSKSDQRKSGEFDYHWQQQNKDNTIKSSSQSGSISSRSISSEDDRKDIEETTALDLVCSRPSSEGSSTKEPRMILAKMLMNADDEEEKGDSDFSNDNDDLNDDDIVPELKDEQQKVLDLISDLGNEKEIETQPSSDTSPRYDNNDDTGDNDMRRNTEQNYEKELSKHDDDGGEHVNIDSSLSQFVQFVNSFEKLHNEMKDSGRSSQSTVGDNWGGTATVTTSSQPVLQGMDLIQPAQSSYSQDKPYSRQASSHSSSSFSDSPDRTDITRQQHTTGRGPNSGTVQDAGPRLPDLGFGSIPEVQRPNPDDIRIVPSAISQASDIRNVVPNHLGQVSSNVSHSRESNNMGHHNSTVMARVANMGPPSRNTGVPTTMSTAPEIRRDPNMDMTRVPYMAMGMAPNMDPYTSRGVPNMDIGRVPNMDIGRDIGGVPNMDMRRGPNMDIGRVPNMDMRSGPNMDIGRVPNMDMRSGPNMDMRRVPNMDMGRVPNMDIGRVPNMDIGRVPNMDMRRVPNMDIGRVPNMDMGRIPNMDMGRVPNMDIGRVPSMEVERMAHLDSLRHTLPNVPNQSYGPTYRHREMSNHGNMPGSHGKEPMVQSRKSSSLFDIDDNSSIPVHQQQQAGSDNNKLNSSSFENNSYASAPLDFSSGMVGLDVVKSTVDESALYDDDMDWMNSKLARHRRVVGSTSECEKYRRMNSMSSVTNNKPKTEPPRRYSETSVPTSQYPTPRPPLGPHTSIDSMASSLSCADNMTPVLPTAQGAVSDLINREKAMESVQNSPTVKGGSGGGPRSMTHPYGKQLHALSIMSEGASNDVPSKGTPPIDMENMMEKIKASFSPGSHSMKVPFIGGGGKSSGASKQLAREEQDNGARRNVGGGDVGGGRAAEENGGNKQEAPPWENVTPAQFTNENFPPWEPPAIDYDYWLQPKLPNRDIFLSDAHNETIQTILSAYKDYVEDMEGTLHYLQAETQRFYKKYGTLVPPLEVLRKELALFAQSTVSFCCRIPGFSTLSQDDQIILFRVGGNQARVLASAFQWYDRTAREYTIFYPLKPHPARMDYNFYLKGKEFCQQVRETLEIDLIEEALFNVVLYFSTDYNGLTNPEQISKVRWQILECFTAYTTAKYGSSNNIIERMFSVIPMLRRVGLLEHQLSVKMSLLKDESYPIPDPCTVKQDFPLPDLINDAITAPRSSTDYTEAS